MEWLPDLSLDLEERVEMTTAKVSAKGRLEVVTEAIGFGIPIRVGIVRCRSVTADRQTYGLNWTSFHDLFCIISCVSSVSCLTISVLKLLVFSTLNPVVFVRCI